MLGWPPVGFWASSFFIIFLRSSGRPRLILEIFGRLENFGEILEPPASSAGSGAGSFIFSDFTDLFLRRLVSFSGDSSAQSFLLMSCNTYKKSSTKILSEVSEIKILAGCCKSAENFRQLSVLGVHDFSPHFDRFFFAGF